MTDKPDPSAHAGAPLRDTGAVLLAAGGFAAAFGAASCCALPLLLGSLGLGSTWLVAVAWIAAPHRVALLGFATSCLVAAGGLLLWGRRRAAAYPPGTSCGRPALTAFASGVLSLAGVLIVLGFVYR